MEFNLITSDVVILQNYFAPEFSEVWTELEVQMQFAIIILKGENMRQSRFKAAEAVYLIQH
jgi:hypothetical protein